MALRSSSGMSPHCASSSWIRSRYCMGPSFGGLLTSLRRTRRAGIDTELEQGPHLDRAVGIVAQPPGPLHGRGERLRLDQVVAAEHFLRLGERPVDDHPLAAAEPNRACLRRWGERGGVDERARL